MSLERVAPDWLQQALSEKGKRDLAQSCLGKCLFTLRLASTKVVLWYSEMVN